MDHVKNRLVGVRYLTDAQGTTWFDNDIKEIQKKIDDILPSTINLLSFSRHYTDQFIVITAYYKHNYLFFFTLALPLTFTLSW